MNAITDRIKSSALKAALIVSLSHKDQFAPGVTIINGSSVATIQDIPKSSIVYTGSPILHYEMPQNGDNRCGLICAAPMLSSYELRELFRRISNLYPRTTDEYTTLIERIYPRASSEEKRDILFSIYHRIDAMCTANAFRVGDRMFLFDGGSMFNHSCRPNCIFSIDSSSGELVIITLENIKANTELTILYSISIVGESRCEVRREMIMRKFYFLCMCRRCANTCAECGRDNAPSRCSRCKSVSYCNVACQRAHWSLHKNKCR